MSASRAQRANTGPEEGGDVAAVAAETDAQVADARAQEIGPAPQAAEPLLPERVNALSETLVDTFMALTDGQLGEPPPPTEVQEPVDQLPDTIYQQATAMAGAAQALGIPELAFDPGQLATTNDGLVEMASRVSTMGTDPKVKQKMAAPPQGPPPDAGAQAVPAGPPDTAGLV